MLEDTSVMSKVDYLLFELKLCINDFELLKDELSPADMKQVAQNLTIMRDSILAKQHHQRIHALYAMI